MARTSGRPTNTAPIGQAASYTRAIVAMLDSRNISLPPASSVSLSTRTPSLPALPDENDDLLFNPPIPGGAPDFGIDYPGGPFSAEAKNHQGYPMDLDAWQVLEVVEAKGNAEFAAATARAAAARAAEQALTTPAAPPHAATAYFPTSVEVVRANAKWSAIPFERMAEIVLRTTMKSIDLEIESLAQLHQMVIPMPTDGATFNIGDPVLVMSGTIIYGTTAVIDAPYVFEDVEYVPVLFCPVELIEYPACTHGASLDSKAKEFLRYNTMDGTVPVDETPRVFTPKP
jgi:hypothetical protein